MAKVYSVSRPLAGLISGLIFVTLSALAQDRIQPANRITEAIDNRNMVVRSGDVHPLASAEYDQGAAPSDLRMDRMVLVLQPDPAQEQALEELLAAQQGPSSPDYQRWVTLEAFGASFGVSGDDVDQIVAWLQSSGFDVEPVSAAHRVIIFSGSAEQVAATFHTAVHIYEVNGVKHYANQRPPAIPRALASVVRGVASLNDFHSTPLYAGLHAAPLAGGPGLGGQWTSGSSHYLTPGDFGVIYATASLYADSTDGTGQSIAVIGRTNINLSDVQTFRNMFGLPARLLT